MKIISERLIVRHFQESDFNDYFEIESQPFKHEYYSERWWDLHRISEARRFEDILKSDNFYALSLKASSKVVGRIKLCEPRLYYPYGLVRGAELDVRTNEDFRNKGLMTEAVKSITKYGFDELDLEAIYARILSENGASLRVFDKCGYNFKMEQKEFIDFDELELTTTKGLTKQEYLDNPVYKALDVKFDRT